jgi:subtilase family serine protease
MPADLTISSLALGSASVVQGQNLGFVYTVVNIGASLSNVGYASFYIDGWDEAHFRGYNLTDPLTTDATRTLFNGFNTSNLSVGQHTLWVGADNYGQTAETDETNNWRSITFTVTAPPQADLEVSSLGLGATSVVQGQNLGFVYTVVNTDAGQSNAGYASFYIDGMSEAYFRGYNFTDPLGSGASRTLFNGFNTANLSVGQHTLWVGSDNYGQTTESDETNNWRSITFTVTAPPQADLEVTSLALGASSVAQGQNLGFVYTVLNDGAAQSNLGYASFYIDGMSEPFFRGYNLTDPLGSGASRTLFNGFNTANLSVGQHTLWVGSDNYGQTTESDETNNWRSITFTVTAPPRADLEVRNLALGATSVAQGQNLGFVFTVLNDGAAQSNAGYASFYIDGMSEAFFRGYNFTDPLGEGASRTLFNGFNTSNLSVGQHTLWVGSDNYGQTTESDETNNWQSITFTVTAPPPADLVVSNISPVTMSVVQGGFFTFNYTITNTGSSTSSPSVGAFDIDRAPNTQHWVALDNTNGLAPGTSQTFSEGFSTAGMSVGQHTLYVAADNFNSIGEGSEANNVTAINFTVTGPSLPFNISVAYLGSSAYQSYFTQAAQRWQQVITTDLPDVASSLYGSIDDVLIHASVVSIDGAGGILGQAGPDQFRSGAGGLPYHGIMRFDSADLASMASNGTLLSVILHEMGHVLGLGTLWSSFGLRSGSSYIGGGAVNAYHQLGGQGSTVPLETTGGSGTALVHWSDSVFGNELMTGFISGTSNPLSILTIGSLQDLGYRVNYAAADGYSIPGRLEGGASVSGGSDQAATMVALHDHEHGGLSDFDVGIDPLTEWTIII